MSVAPDDPLFLQKHRRPSRLGGIGLDPVWYIDEGDLGPDLMLRLERLTHGLIEPSRPMTLLEFETALARTRAHWRLYCR